MCRPWMPLTPANRLRRKSVARPDAMISTSCAPTRCSRITRDRIAWPIPSPTTPYRIFMQPMLIGVQGGLGEMERGFARGRELLVRDGAVAVHRAEDDVDVR